MNISDILNGKRCKSSQLSGCCTDVLLHKQFRTCFLSFNTINERDSFVVTNNVCSTDVSVAHSWRLLWSARVYRTAVRCPEDEEKGLDGKNNNSHITHK